jgi:hypothetical protein
MHTRIFADSPLGRCSATRRRRSPLAGVYALRPSLPFVVRVGASPLDHQRVCYPQRLSRPLRTFVPAPVTPPERTAMPPGAVRLLPC